MKLSILLIVAAFIFNGVSTQTSNNYVPSAPTTSSAAEQETATPSTQMTTMAPMFTDEPPKYGEYKYKIMMRCRFTRTWNSKYEDRQSQEFRLFSLTIYTQLNIQLKLRKMRIVIFIIVRFSQYQSSGITVEMQYTLASSERYDVSVVKETISNSTTEAFNNTATIEETTSSAAEQETATPSTLKDTISNSSTEVFNNTATIEETTSNAAEQEAATPSTLKETISNSTTEVFNNTTTIEETTSNAAEQEAATPSTPTSNAAEQEAATASTLKDTITNSTTKAFNNTATIEETTSNAAEQEAATPSTLKNTISNLTTEVFNNTATIEETTSNAAEQEAATSSTPSVVKTTSRIVSTANTTKVASKINSKFILIISLSVYSHLLS